MLFYKESKDFFNFKKGKQSKSSSISYKVEKLLKWFLSNKNSIQYLFTSEINVNYFEILKLPP